MNKDAIFDDISIMGRVIYIIFAIEIYLLHKAFLKETNYNEWIRKTSRV